MRQSASGSVAAALLCCSTVHTRLSFYSMASKFEVVVSSSPREGIDVWSLHSGAHIKAVEIPDFSGILECLDADNLLITQAAKGGIQHWNWRTASVRSKSPMVEHVCSITHSHTSSRCKLTAAGTTSGKVFVWDSASGELLRSWPGHYKAVSQIQFTSDGYCLISAGEDAIVNVWLLADILASESAVDTKADSDSLEPYIQWTGHSLAVTSLVCGSGGIGGKVLTGSLDRTCKLWDIPSKRQLLSFIYPSHVTSLCLHPSEHVVFVGTGSGIVFKTPLSQQAPIVSEKEEEKASSSGQQLIGHTKTVTDLQCSFDGSKVVSACKDGTLKVWDTETGQPLRTLEKQRKSCHTVRVLKNYRDLFGQNYTMPMKTFPSLAKYVKAQDQNTSIGLVQPEPTPTCANPRPTKRHRVMATDFAVITQHAQHTKTDDVNPAMKVRALTQEVEEWKAAARRLYDTLTKQQSNQ